GRPWRSRLMIPDLSPDRRRLTCQEQFFETQRQIEAGFRETRVSFGSAAGRRQRQNEIGRSPAHRAKRKPGRSEVAEQSGLLRARGHRAPKLGDCGVGATLQDLESNQIRPPVSTKPARRIGKTVRSDLNLAGLRRAAIGEVLQSTQASFQRSSPTEKVRKDPFRSIMSPSPQADREPSKAKEGGRQPPRVQGLTIDPGGKIA